jgi:hypothetical protein
MVADAKSRELNVNTGKSNRNPTSNNGNPTPEEASYEQLRDRLSEIEGVEEGLAEFIARNWQRVFISFACILLVVWLANQVRNSQSAQEEHASTLFSSAQQAYEAINTINGNSNDSEISKEGISAEQLNRAKVVFNENIKALNEEKNGTYVQFGKLYQARELLDQSEIDSAREILIELGALNVLDKNNTRENRNKIELGREQLTKELAGLLYAKSFIDSDITKARNFLIQLSSTSILVVEESLVALIRIAKTPEDITQAVSAAKDAIAANPQLSDAIEKTFQEQGVTIFQF